MSILTLSEVASFASGGTPKRSIPAYFDGDIPWITGADIGVRNTITPRSFITAEAVAKSAVAIVPKGTLLLVTRTSVGKVAVADRGLGFSQDITAISPDTSLVDPDYLAFFLAAYAPRLASQARGATILGVTRAEVGAIPIPLPPLPKQRRIAEILDRADELRAKRRHALTLLDELSRSLFSTAFGSHRYGPATHERFANVITEMQNGFYMPSSEYGSGTPILRIADFAGGARLSLSNLNRVRAAIGDVERFVLAEGDLVVNRVNAMSHVGKSALVTHVSEETIFESNMMRVRLDRGRICPEYALAWLNTAGARAQIRSAAKQAINQASVNQQDIAALRLPVPPMDDQRAYLSLNSMIDSLLEQETSHLAKLDELFASLQHRAFSGQL